MTEKHNCIWLVNYECNLSIQFSHIRPINSCDNWQTLNLPSIKHILFITKNNNQCSNVPLHYSTFTTKPSLSTSSYSSNEQQNKRLHKHHFSQPLQCNSVTIISNYINLQLPRLNSQHITPLTHLISTNIHKANKQTPNKIKKITKERNRTMLILKKHQNYWKNLEETTNEHTNQTVKSKYRNIYKDEYSVCVCV